MMCVICTNGETKAATTTVTLERDDATFVAKGVPAEVCENCGEEYVDEGVAARLLAEAETAAKSGTRVQIREYVPK